MAKQAPEFRILLRDKVSGMSNTWTSRDRLRLVRQARHEHRAGADVMVFRVDNGNVVFQLGDMPPSDIALKQ